MVSFAQLWEQLDKEKTPLMDSGENGQAMNVLKLGKDLHHQKQTPFWDEFISICSNSEGLSNLLGISKEKIQSWPARIKEGLEKLENQTINNPHDKENREIIPTGLNGALTTNQDPNLGEMP